MGEAAEELRTAPCTRPILFSGEMVRQILAGRKTQTRRPVRFRTPDWNTAPDRVHMVSGCDGRPVFAAGDGRPTGAIREHFAQMMGMPCPLGSPGDRLWVRETWCSGDQYYQGHENDVPSVVGYRADHSAIQWEAEPPRQIPDYDIKQWNWDKAVWRPSIHMPRWASRLTLEITGVRVERLQDISEADARAEGVRPLQMDNGSFIPVYEGVWDSVYAKRAPWGSNPWVWVISFKRIEGKEAAA